MEASTNRTGCINLFFNVLEVINKIFFFFFFVWGIYYNEIYSNQKNISSVSSKYWIYTYLKARDTPHKMHKEKGILQLSKDVHEDYLQRYTHPPCTILAISQKNFLSEI